MNGQHCDVKTKIVAVCWVPVLDQSAPDIPANIALQHQLSLLVGLELLRLDQKL